ncbi:MAG: Coenzyme F420 hydrogenase/dehydrogenase, beta subunit C-terminal domain [Oscillospiraceae bacterium]|nr:Coenzyme F420 hydrogenase/dehydrogenase, beta subunit C-terminal domain [Oscillospiraceae bacterium]
MIKITDEKSCSGCYACANVCPKQCISMESNSEGFWYPKVNEEQCIDCNLCEKTCPIISKTEVQSTPVAYAAYNRDEQTRMGSSSGGIFALIAENILQNGGVVFGAGFDMGFNVVHSYVETNDALNTFQGSKYVQSKIGDTFQQAKSFLNQGRQVLFSGTPCQIGGLKKYLEKDYDNLICQDIICHGVPSPRVWGKFLSECEKRQQSSVNHIDFRNKSDGWHNYKMSICFENGNIYKKSNQNNSYIRAFQQNLTLRPSCYACVFKTLHRLSDITLADFWGIESVVPDMFDDKGVSLVLINSDKGKAIFNAVSNKLVYKEADIHEAIKCNSAALKSVCPHPKRDYFFENLEHASIDCLVEKCCHQSVPTRIVKFVYRVGSKLKRMIIK